VGLSLTQIISLLILAVGDFIDLVGQNWINILTAIFYAALPILELAFLPETLYPRNYMLAKEKERSKKRERVEIFIEWGKVRALS
jgi:hypothetical protein